MNHSTTKRWGLLGATCLLIPILVLVGSAQFKATAGPTPAFVRSTVAARTGGGNALTTPALSTASGDLFVVAVSWDGGSINVNVTDNKGNAYSAATTKQVDTRHNQSMQVFYVAYGAGGASHTFTATPSSNASYMRVVVHEVSGISRTSALDKTMVVNNEAGAPVSVGPITTAVSGEYVFAAVMNDSGSNTFAPASGNGFTERATASQGASELQSQDMVQVASGSISSTWTMSGTNHAMAQVVSFRPASAVSDIEAPSVPANLQGSAASPNQVNLSWSASTDNIGVAGYSVYRNGTQVATAASTSFQDSGLTQGTTYTYAVSAYDAASNTSSLSSPVSATTSLPPPDEPPPPPTPTGPITAPLKLSSQNSHYFVDGNGRAVALTGSHTWNDFQDWSANGTTHPFDFSAYVNMLASTHQNFTLLWNTEMPNFCNLPTGATMNFDVAQMPWQRTGPGTANDGKPKFDLTKFDQSFFDRLRAEVQQLNAAGVYAGVYAYTGEWLNVFRCSGDGFPLTGTNNVNSISDGGGVGALSMTAPNALTAIQDAYVEKLVDTLNDLPNVLWATSEESSENSVWWNSHQIDHIRAYEASKPFQHPVGYGNMTNEVDSKMINSNADWIAPGTRVSTSANCGSGTPACKVIINDSDHSYFGMWNDTAQQNRNYVWDNFTNGSSVLFMDPYEVYYPRETRNLCVGPVNGICSAPDSRWDNMRNNLGYTRLYADRMNLLAMTPQGSRSSTHNVLANTDPTASEYLVYSDGGGAFTVNLSNTTRSLGVEWLNPATGVKTTAPSITGGASAQSFTPPFSGDAVLYVYDSSLGVADTQAPTVPTGLTAAAASAAQVNLAWSASTDDRSVAGYRVVRNGTQIAVTTNTSYQDTSLTSQTSYTYTVAAFDAANNQSAASLPATATTTAADTVAPSVPADLAANSTIAGQIGLSWSSSTDDSGSVAGYRVYRDGTNIATTTATSVTDTGLAASTAYSYTVVAFDASGNASAQSSSVSATTPATPSGLVAAYSMNQGAGTTMQDLSGNGNTGTLINNPAWTAGKYGTALLFNGNNQRVDVANSASLRLTTGMTLSAWIKPAIVTSAWRDIIMKGQDEYYLVGESSIGGVPATGGTYTSPLSGSALTVNSWSYVAATYDGASLKLYVNGVQVASRSQTGAIKSSTGKVGIGGDGFWGQYFNGLIDDVRIYNRALAPAEIQGDMNTPL
ncbi:MAG TPA: LamG-like jellyroll fold domain-containing protein [Ilumatobacteraceae bacterium]|nr:LamG-like jellyroll fold domain-containing protein [Ilumatobacteraceae bacterium]